MGKTAIRATVEAVTLAAVCACASLNANTRKPAFRVIGFFTGKEDQAHVSFLHEAERWFPEVAAKYGFRFDTTSNWRKLNAVFSPTMTSSCFWIHAPKIGH